MVISAGRYWLAIEDRVTSSAQKRKLCSRAIVWYFLHSAVNMSNEITSQPQRQEFHRKAAAVQNEWKVGDLIFVVDDGTQQCSFFQLRGRAHHLYYYHVRR